MKAVERLEAAEYLGVSLSTLDRLASQGRLTKGRSKRKTRPVTVFDEGELAQLKGELQSTKSLATPKPHGQAKIPDGVGFRLDPYYVERLLAEGGKRGMSAGEYARTLVVRALEDDREEGFRKELASLRTNLAEMFFLILVSKLGASSEDAKAVVSSILGGGASDA